MKKIPLFSLLIATVRRRTELEKLLFTLRQQQYQHIQIIIADQNPPSFLEDLHAQFSDLPLQIIPVPDKGVSQARNAIIPLAEGSYIAFPDDDCWYAHLRFDPRLGPGTGLPYGCGEDTDYLLEAHKRAPVWRCPSIRVFHPSPDTHVPSDAKIASYAAGRMYLLKKHAFPLWFRCANVLYPLCILPLDALRKGRKAARYRWRMFVERLRHFSS